jgi:RNA polymerase sigma factor (sigma-70 family)
MKQNADNTGRRAEDFEAVVATYEGALLRYAMRLLNRNTIAQDVVQEAFLKLFRSWQDAYAPSPQLAAWLYRVTHNEAVDYLRKETRRDQVHEGHAEGAPDMHPPDCGNESRVSDEAHQAAQVLRTLSLREQQLVILKVYEEKSYREISEITGLTVTHVGYILHTAMKKMAQALRPPEDAGGGRQGETAP